MDNLIYKGVLLGFEARGSFNKEHIFRVRHGNGKKGSIKGQLYQDRYVYFVPSSIRNPQSQWVRDLYSQARFNWFGLLTELQRKEYNSRAKGMSGYNLYIKEYINSHK